WCCTVEPIRSEHRKISMVEVKVPQLSESVSEATLLQWKKKAGERVELDEVLIEVETDKVVLEVPAPAAGTLAQIVKPDGSTVVAGEVIAMIDPAPAKAAAGKPGAAAAPAALAATAPAGLSAAGAAPGAVGAGALAPASGAARREGSDRHGAAERTAGAAGPDVALAPAGGRAPGAVAVDRGHSDDVQ